MVFVTGGRTIKRRRRVNEITPVSRFRPSGRNKLESVDSNRSLPLRNTLVKNIVEEVEEFIAFPNLKYIPQRSSWMKLEKIENRSCCKFRSWRDGYIVSYWISNTIFSKDYCGRNMKFLVADAKRWGKVFFVSRKKLKFSTTEKEVSFISISKPV